MQLALALNIPATRQLIPMEAAVVLLDRSEEEVMAAIESGGLSAAWDIGASTRERREIRIYRESLLAFLAGVRGPEDDFVRGATPGAAGEVSTLEDRIIPHRDVRSTELRRWWSCSNNLVRDLIILGHLTVCGGGAAASGPNAYRVLSRDSVVAFLRSRRVT